MRNAIVDHINWRLAQFLYFQGVPVQKIADHIGVTRNALCMRVGRENWQEHANTARLLAENLGKHTPEVASLTSAERAEQWVDAVSKNVQDSVRALSKLKIPKTLMGMRDYEEVWKIHTARGRATFGLDKATTSVTINCGLIGLPKSPTPDVIDVEPQEQLTDVAGDSQSAPLP